MTRAIRIGNGCGFWGDNLDAPVVLAKHGRLDYLTLEYLAELTMSILALLKQRDVNAGFATDFLDVLKRLTPVLQQQPRLKIITNAGGMNPAACARQTRAILQQAGLVDKKIAVVVGDDLLPHLDRLLSEGHPFTNLDTSEPLEKIRSKIVSANAYLGSQPIAQALNEQADLVITGRVADACLTVGPAIHEFGWEMNDWDRLCAATVAGHLIECGAQATGGLWEHWQQVPEFANVGYPIAEISADGSFVLTKPEGSGGVVNHQTVCGQLLYEVNDPAAYYTPDVVADFTSISVKETVKDRVAITGAKGNPSPEKLKVSVAYRDGYMCSGMLAIYGGDAVGKARLAGQMILDRVKRAGFTFARSNIETIGAGAVVPIGSLGDAQGVYAPRSEHQEVMLRVTVHDANKAALERFSKEFAPLVTAGPPGTTGYTTGRPQIREVFAYWPALVARNAVQPQVLWE